MDLKSFREDKLKKTPAEFATLIGVDESRIAAWEKAPGSVCRDDLEKICKATNTPLLALFAWEKPKSLVIDNTWAEADRTKHSLTEYISKAIEQAGLPNDQQKNYIDGLQEIVAANIVKPQVTIVGRSDTGKSTMINNLLGADKMPTSWTPTTAIAVYIKHISDKPAFIEEDAWVFTNQVGDEKIWDVRRLNDEDYCNRWKIDAGGVEILRSYGIRQGQNYRKEAGAAVVFLDAPILNTCDIVDLPGFGTETENDDNITFNVSQKADIIIYLSQANGFMRIEDITYLKRNINELPIWEKFKENHLPPLANLFVVASQAHTVNFGDVNQLNTILDTGCANLLKTLPDEYWANRQKISGYDYVGYGKLELRARFFTYTTDMSELRNKFNDALKQTLEILPTIIDARAKEAVRNYISARKPNLTKEMEKYEKIIEERASYEALLVEIDHNESSRIADNDKRKADIRAEIQLSRKESQSEFIDYLNETVNTDALVKLIQAKGIKNKRDDIELFGSSLQSMIQSKCEAILAEKANRLSKKAEDYITSFAESVSCSFEKNGLDVDFDAAWAFASALSKLGMIGGLGGLLFSTATGAALFAGLGLSAGSAVFMGLLSSSLLGPIGIAAGLLLTGVLGAIKLFGGGWQKTVAEKFVKAFDKNDIASKFYLAIDNYWDQTDNAFTQAAIALDDEWSAYIEKLRDAVQEHDIHDLEYKIQSLKTISDFFDNIPL